MMHRLLNSLKHGGNAREKIVIDKYMQIDYIVLVKSGIEEINGLFIALEDR
jgi:hypothetical protein